MRPEPRYRSRGILPRHGDHPHTVLTLEYYHDKDYDHIKNADIFTAQLAYEF